jgi:hypothetical protein
LDFPHLKYFKEVGAYSRRISLVVMKRQREGTQFESYQKDRKTCANSLLVPEKGRVCQIAGFPMPAVGVSFW